jgi:ABC-type glycerol-3-phosphate transport system substrate-binding protein
MGPAIDFYGRTQVAQGGADRLGFVMPANLTVVTPDPIAILKGAPNLDNAKLFVDFVMSEEGQRLWFLKAGSPGGPAKYDLMRLPVLPKIYDRYEAAVKVVDVNPFTFTSSFSFDSAKASARREVLGDLMKSTLIQPQKELRACWKAVLTSAKRDALVDKMAKAPVDEAQALDFARSKWDDQVFRGKKTTEWVEFALRKYGEVRAEAQ